MSVLRLNVLGPPEVSHDGRRLTFGLRKAQALLLYLAVEGGLHPRSKLAALLWPDSEPHAARKALRNALTLLRRLLADRDPSAPAHGHLLRQQELLGLDPQAQQALDLEVVQQAYHQAQQLSTLPSQEQRAALVSQVQHALALVRGPFLEGFWLREETGFDAWVQQQQQQWQVRLQLLFERLSSFQESGGELESACLTLTRWLALDALSEEAYRRLMRVHLALGDASAAWQVYATCRAHLAEELGVKPSADTLALAEHIRATAARRGSPAARPSTTAENQPPSALVAPLVGRQASFTQLVGRYQQARGGQPQAVLVVGEAGIGKTRLAREFVAWAQAQGAEVLSGQAFEMGGRLPYQPLVEALRPRLEAENAPEDLLDDVWLAELSRLLPELRVRYPDLPAAREDELAGKGRLFEAVARLVDALARRAPLVLLLDDLHWVDEASLDLLRFLGRYWKGHGTRVLLVGTVCREELELHPQLATQLFDLGRDLPVKQVVLQPLSQAESLQLLEAITGEAEHGSSRGGERSEDGSARPATARPGAEPSPELERPLVALGDFLFAHTGGQPLYLLETLKLLRDRQWLVPRLGADGTWRLEPVRDMAAAVAQEQSRDLPRDIEHTRYMFPVPVPGPLSSDRVSDPAGQRAFSHRLLAQEPVKMSGGTVRIVDSRNFPAASTIAAALVEVEPGAMRELHWHPTNDEWQYYIAGSGRMTVFASEGKARTFDYQAGDVGYVPLAMGHYIENTGDTMLRFLELFKSPRFADVSLNQWMALTPPELVQAHLNLTPTVMGALRKQKRPIV